MNRIELVYDISLSDRQRQREAETERKRQREGVRIPLSLAEVRASETRKSCESEGEETDDRDNSSERINCIGSSQK